MRTLVVVLGAAVCGLPLVAQASNAPESLQERWQDQYIVKLSVACGIKLTLKLDGDSLRKANKDIKNDQTDGANECGEGLRYLYYACKSPEGRSAVKSAGIHEIVCKGADKGALTLKGGTITIERAFEEPKPTASRTARRFSTRTTARRSSKRSSGMRER
jgi:hypothetical protein